MANETSGQSQDELIGYDQLDAFKRQATKAGLDTTHVLEDSGVEELTWTRGESCYVLDHGDFYSGHVIEGLGTKNRVVEQLIELTRMSSGTDFPRNGYSHIARDTIAMIVNDLITLGIPPMVIGMHLAVGDSAWFEDEVAVECLVSGWQSGCHDSGAVWGFGETPTLREIVEPGTIEISGSATGFLHDRDMLVNPANIQPDDVIVGLASSGVHANGLTKAREIANATGFYTTMPGTTRQFGVALTDPTVNCVPFLRACQKIGLRWSYGVNVTGHGWRKIMRYAGADFTYVIQKVPGPQPVFKHIAQHGEIDVREMYATYNMGVGFIVIVRPNAINSTLEVAQECGMDAMLLGHVKEGPRRVIIEPLDIVYWAEELKVR